MDIEDGNNFMASFYNIKALLYYRRLMIHKFDCVTFLEKQGLSRGNESALLFFFRSCDGRMIFFT